VSRRTLAETKLLHLQARDAFVQGDEAFLEKQLEASVAYRDLEPAEQTSFRSWSQKLPKLVTVNCPRVGRA